MVGDQELKPMRIRILIGAGLALLAFHASGLAQNVNVINPSSRPVPVFLANASNTAPAPTPFANLGANATLNVKSGAGAVYSVSCYNANTSSRYIQLHDTATTPAGGAAPKFSFLVPPGGQIVIGTDFFTQAGVSFSSGIAFAFSTTLNTYTAATAADQSTFVNYK